MLKTVEVIENAGDRLLRLYYVSFLLLGSQIGWRRDWSINRTETSYADGTRV
jgi:hypothetical protein